MPTLSLARRLRLRAARARRWEFWPAWLFYLPVVAWILWLALRFRSARAFTAANPGMDDGGVVGERKTTLLSPLMQARADAVPAFELLPAGQATETRLATALDFAGRHRWPVVLKPDVGQRGRGVAVVRSEAALAAYLAHADYDLLIQRFAAGAEFGVFVYREPGDGRLRILSICEKRLPCVTGDGQRNLAQLILDDPRAALNAELLFRQHADRLHEVPAAAQAVPLVELGTHCRGATFLDACALAGEPLRAALDALTAPLLPGFHFGRLDLKAPDAEALRQGRELQVMEINGVTSESAHVYHPGASLLAGYRAFFRQWWLAFAIGKANLRAGARGLNPVALLPLWHADRQRGDSAEAAVKAAQEAA